MFLTAILQRTHRPHVPKPQGLRKIIRLQSMAGTGYTYTTTKRRDMLEPVMRVKHDPLVNRHVLFQEKKVGKGHKPSKADVRKYHPVEKKDSPHGNNTFIVRHRPDFIKDEWWRY